MNYLTFILIAVGAFSLLIIIIVAVTYWKESSLETGYFLIEIEEEQIKGEEKDRKRLETIGGPGQLVVHPGQVVVLHHQGKITRAVGVGLVRLGSGEKIKAIIPLGGKAGVQKIENVLTRDRIDLTLSVAHGASSELVSGTKKRLEETKNKVARDENALELLKAIVQRAVATDDLDRIKQHLAHMEAQEMPDKEKIELLKKYKEALEQLDKDKKTIEQLQKIVDGGQMVGDEYDQCYVDIAKLVTAKGPDPWGATKRDVEVNLRDVFMANEFEDLFKIGGEAEDLKAKIDQRRIAEIEKFVLDKVKGSKLGYGIVLGFVDINEVYFPEMIQEKLKKVSEASLDEQAAVFEARAIVIRARARAQAKILEGQSEGEARAAFFRELLRELKREKMLPEEAVAHEVLGLISRMASAKDWESFAKATPMMISGQSAARSEETNGSQR